MTDLFYGMEDMIRFTDNPDLDWCMKMVKFWIKGADPEFKPILVKFLRRLEAGETRFRDEIERLRSELDMTSYNSMGTPADDMEDNIA